MRFSGGGVTLSSHKRTKTKIPLLLLSVPLLLTSPAVLASDFGCEALLCFAGGKGLSECKPTIRKVIKDMAKGKGFPHCSFVNSSGGVAGSGDDYISVNRYNQTVPFNQKYCQDGETRPIKLVMTRSAYCKTIQINVKPEYATDKEHETQYFNYE